VGGKEVPTTSTSVGMGKDRSGGRKKNIPEYAFLARRGFVESRSLMTETSPELTAARSRPLAMSPASRLGAVSQSLSVGLSQSLCCLRALFHLFFPLLAGKWSAMLCLSKTEKSRSFDSGSTISSVIWRTARLVGKEGRGRQGISMQSSRCRGVARWMPCLSG